MAVDENTLRVRNTTGGISTVASVFAAYGSGDATQVDQLWDRDPATGAPRKIYQSKRNMFQKRWTKVDTGIIGLTQIKYVADFNAWFAVDTETLFKSTDGIKWNKMGNMTSLYTTNPMVATNWEIIPNVKYSGYLLVVYNSNNGYLVNFSLNADGSLLKYQSTIAVPLSELAARVPGLAWDSVLQKLWIYNSSTSTNLCLFEADLSKSTTFTGGRWHSHCKYSSGSVMVAGRYSYCRAYFSAKLLRVSSSASSEAGGIGYNPDPESGMVIQGNFASNYIYQYPSYASGSHSTMSLPGLPKDLISWFDDLQLWGALESQGTSGLYGYFSTDGTTWSRGSKIADSLNLGLATTMELKQGYNPQMKRLIVRDASNPQILYYVDA